MNFANKFCEQNRIIRKNNNLKKKKNISRIEKIDGRKRRSEHFLNKILFRSFNILYTFPYYAFSFLSHAPIESNDSYLFFLHEITNHNKKKKLILSILDSHYSVLFRIFERSRVKKIRFFRCTRKTHNPVVNEFPIDRFLHVRFYL